MSTKKLQKNSSFCILKNVNEIVHKFYTLLMMQKSYIDIMYIVILTIKYMYKQIFYYFSLYLDINKLIEAISIIIIHYIT